MDSSSEEEEEVSSKRKHESDSSSGESSGEESAKQKKKKSRLSRKSEKRKSEKSVRKAKRKTVEKVKVSCGAGSDEHRAQRWKEYQESGGEWSKERWDKVYDVNMVKASKAHEAVNAYHKKVGWGKREVTVKVEPGIYRRLDIADEDGKKAIEHKTGYISLSEEIQWEIDRDADLVKQGWDITWHFQKDKSKPYSGPTFPLEVELGLKGIKVTTEEV
jgi:hypothetical protein